MKIVTTGGVRDEDGLLTPLVEWDERTVWDHKGAFCPLCGTECRSITTSWREGGKATDRPESRTFYPCGCIVTPDRREEAR